MSEPDPDHIVDTYRFRLLIISILKFYESFVQNKT
jgi:hypothetical protein